MFATPAMSPFAAKSLRFSGVAFVHNKSFLVASLLTVLRRLTSPVGGGLRGPSIGGESRGLAADAPREEGSLTEELP